MPPSALRQTQTSSWHVVGASVLWSILAIITILLLLLIPLLCWYYRRRKLRGILSKEEVVQFELGRIPPLPPKTLTEGLNTEKEIALSPHDRELEIPKEKFIFGKKDLLGNSRYCSVFRCKLTGKEQEIALKTSRHRWKRDAVKSILDDIKVLAFIGKHQNIASIVGTYTGEIKQGVVYLATDLCVLGTLQRYLHDIKEQATTITTGTETDDRNIGNGIDITELFRFSHEIASGMKYLASKNFTHGDICTHNVLLDSLKTCKITNISGLKRRNVVMNMINQNMEPKRWQWIAYESLERFEFSTKSDIYAFGVTLFEIFSFGNAPYSDMGWSKDFSKILANGLQISRPLLASQKLYDLILKCCDLNPDSRPEVADFLCERWNV